MMTSHLRIFFLDPISEGLNIVLLFYNNKTMPIFEKRKSNVPSYRK